MNLAVKLYSAETTNLKNVPSTWPSQVLELGESTSLPDDTWVLMTIEEYTIYRSIHQPSYDAWYLSYIAALPSHTPSPETVIITSAPDPAPFAQPTYRTKRNATTNLVSIAAGDNSDVAFVLTSERYVNGGCLIVENAEIGDYIVAEVEDVNGVIPAPYRTALCENYPVVSTYIEKEFVRVMTPGTVQAGAITVHEINTSPLNAKISANLCLCVHYYAVNSGLTRRLAINYHLTKKL